MNKVFKLAIYIIIILLPSTLLISCSTARHSYRNDDLPILSQDELIRPYVKVGRIQVTREVYGTDYSMTPDIRAWGFNALRQEAEKMGADAVMLPEVSGHTTTSGIIPSTEYRATGVAIKFK